MRAPEAGNAPEVHPWRGGLEPKFITAAEIQAHEAEAWARLAGGRHGVGNSRPGEEDVILRDEIGHVAIGSHWFGWLCDQRGVEPDATFRQLLVDYDAPPLRPPFNFEARREAGFSEPELDWLRSL